MSRHYHAMLTKFNIAYNGNLAFIDGMENIDKANKDDYSQLIHLYPASNHSTLTSAKSNMDRSIEKCRKSIKLHSIKKKPKRDYKRYNDPKYQAFYNQNEFNPELKKAWIQLGKAEFYKGDFLGAAGTFSYITRFYASTLDMVVLAQIWMAKSYIELGWLYEAEEILKKTKKTNVSISNEGIYASTWADLLIRQKEYEQAIPYLKTAISREKNKKQRIRFSFVLAQLMERIGDRKGAYEYYTKVVKSTPNYEMDINARINRAQMLTDNTSGAIKELKKIARNQNNKDYLDQVYTAIGNVYMLAKDTVYAIQNYKLAIEESTRNGIEKGTPLVILGDYYYLKREYVKAHPYYDEAAKIYTNEYDDFQRITHRSEILADLVKEYEIVHLQDSLLKLSIASEEERLEAIHRAIELVILEEKKEEEDKQKAQQKANDDNFKMPMVPIGSSVDWYFYNPKTVANGKTDFRRTWGNRKLEDNWRRSNKSESILAETNEPNIITDSLSTDSINSLPSNDDNTPQLTKSNDKKSIDYYLAQIPFTDAQKQKANEQLATALYNMGFVYKDRIEDYPLAYETFAQFQSRFSSDERILETLFQRFLLASKQQDTQKAAEFRNEILSNYSESKYAQLLEDPDYISNQQKILAEQDARYNQTYSAFSNSDYKTVFSNNDLMTSKYPTSSLLPQFEFLNALSIGKTTGSEQFEQSLSELIEKYPNSSVSTMAKDILALLKQGNIAQQGQTFGTLLTQREKENLTADELEDIHFSELKFSPHRLMLITSADDDAINKLQYNLAIFNFSRFMVKDFALSLIQVDPAQRALSVSGLTSYNESVWYQNTLASDLEMTQMLDSMHVQQVVISDENFEKLKSVFTLDEYLAFEKEILLPNVPSALLAADDMPSKSGKSSKIVEIIDGTKLIEEQRKSSPKENIVPMKSNEAQVENKTKQETKIDETPKELKKESVAPQQQIAKTEDKQQAEPKNSAVQLYKNLYAYTPTAPQYVAFYIPRGGKFDFQLIKKAIETYNANNYTALNLSVNLEEFGKESIVIIGNFTDANVAKSYFLRLLKEPQIVKATSGMNKRNLIITRDNLNTMVSNNALDIYFEFMKEYYLK